MSGSSSRESIERGVLKVTATSPVPRYKLPAEKLTLCWESTDSSYSRGTLEAGSKSNWFLPHSVCIRLGVEAIQRNCYMKLIIIIKHNLQSFCESLH